MLVNFKHWVGSPMVMPFPHAPVEGNSLVCELDWELLTKLLESYHIKIVMPSPDWAQQLPIVWLEDRSSKYRPFCQR